MATNHDAFRIKKWGQKYNANASSLFGFFYLQCFSGVFKHLQNSESCRAACLADCFRFCGYKVSKSTKLS